MSALHGTNVIAPVVPYDTNDVIPTHLDLYGYGGFRVVADIATRDGIPALRRAYGMTVFVQANQTEYQLQADLVTWLPQASSGGGTTYLAHFGDSTPATIYALLDTQALNTIDVAVTEVWNGPGAGIQIGVVGNPGKYFDTTDSDLTEIATFSKDFSELGPQVLIITITPGASPSTGQARIQISTTAAGT